MSQFEIPFSPASPLQFQPERKIDNHVYMLALYFAFYNFCRIHRTLRVTPAMQAGISGTVRDMDWIVGMIDAVAPKPNRPARYLTATAAATVGDLTATVAMWTRASRAGNKGQYRLSIDRAVPVVNSPLPIRNSVRGNHQNAVRDQTSSAKKPPEKRWGKSARVAPRNRQGARF